MRNQIRDLRRRAYDAQGGCCFYCHFPTWICDPEDFARRWSIPISVVHCFQCTAEHLVPISQGGRDEPSNIAAACRFCNQTRHRSRRCARRRGMPST
jgi:5-methylcytosine-specific restriction endonuclease McrA